jgi:putative hemolysin
MDADLIAIAVCLLGSGFFSSSETALTALPVTRLEALRTSGPRLVRAGLTRWAEAPDQILITILIGNNLVNVFASAVATRLAYRMSGEGSLAVVVGLMTLAILVFGEITPKTLAQRNAEWISARVIPVLWAMEIVLRPVNWLLGLLTRMISSSPGPVVPVTEEDLMFMLKLAHRHAQLPRGARHMIERVLRFQPAVAREAMVPRPQVATLDTSWTRDRVNAVVADAGHSRLPVVEGSPDAVVGMLHAKSLIDITRDWREDVTPVPFIPESKPLPLLLEEFRTSGHHMAVVLDEFGGMAGIITLEDTLELLVGDIRDEFDGGREPDILAAPGGWSVAAHVSLRRVEALLDRPVADHHEAESIGGLAVDLLGTDLRVGSVAEWDDIQLEVTTVTDGRPSRLRIRAH